jgi:hypothetical protein
MQYGRGGLYSFPRVPLAYQASGGSLISGFAGKGGYKRERDNKHTNERQGWFVAWARPRPEPYESKNLNGRPSGSGEGVASNVLTAGQCALTRLFRQQSTKLLPKSL